MLSTLAAKRATAALVALSVIAGCAAHPPAQHARTAPAPQPADENANRCRTAAITDALSAAGNNAPELQRAIDSAPPAQRNAVCFLIANMPVVDLQALSATYILENVAWAYTARDTLPWGRDIPGELFLNDVLPYASVNERRDNWRADFFHRFSPLVRDCRTPAEAAQKLNREIFAILHVQYHATKRPKSDQSPYESTAAGYASCTGLSVLLADACRAVCVPARLAGIPQWRDKEGNHTWVEIWDQQWFFVGAAEPDPAGLNRAWFVDDAAKTDPTDPAHRIYATCFQKTGLVFPLAWNADLKYVSARDVTRYYTNRNHVRIEILDRPGGHSVAAEVMLRHDGELVAVAPATASPSADAGVLELELPGRETYSVEIRPRDAAPVQRAFTTGAADETISLSLVVTPP